MCARLYLYMEGLWSMQFIFCYIYEYVRVTVYVDICVHLMLLFLYKFDLLEDMPRR